MLWVLSGSHTGSGKLGLNADLCDSACAMCWSAPGWEWGVAHRRPVCHLCLSGCVPLFPVK